MYINALNKKFLAVEPTCSEKRFYKTRKDKVVVCALYQWFCIKFKHINAKSNHFYAGTKETFHTLKSFQDFATS
jgi:hypothetical protein